MTKELTCILLGGCFGALLAISVRVNGIAKDLRAIRQQLAPEIQKP